MPKAQWLLGDRGYDADWFRDALQAKGIQPCIPGRRSRNEPVRYDKRRYRRRSRIEIMFGRLKDWRRVATRYDRWPASLNSFLNHARRQIGKGDFQILWHLTRGSRPKPTWATSDIEDAGLKRPGFLGGSLVCVTRPYRVPFVRHSSRLRLRRG